MSCVCNISKLLVDCLQNILLLMQGCSKLLLTCARRGVVVSAKWWFMRTKNWSRWRRTRSRSNLRALLVYKTGTNQQRAKQTQRQRQRQRRSARRRKKRQSSEQKQRPRKRNTRSRLQNARQSSPRSRDKREKRRYAIQPSAQAATPLLMHLDCCQVICQHRRSKLIAQKRKSSALIRNGEQLTKMSAVRDPRCVL